jgi:hypothetical protein
MADDRAFSAAAADLSPDDVLFSLGHAAPCFLTRRLPVVFAWENAKGGFEMLPVPIVQAILAEVDPDASGGTSDDRTPPCSLITSGIHNAHVAALAWEPRMQLLKNVCAKKHPDVVVIFSDTCNVWLKLCPRCHMEFDYLLHVYQTWRVDSIERRLDAKLSALSGVAEGLRKALGAQDVDAALDDLNELLSSISAIGVTMHLLSKHDRLAVAIAPGVIAMATHSEELYKNLLVISNIIKDFDAGSASPPFSELEHSVLSVLDVPRGARAERRLRESADSLIQAGVDACNRAVEHGTAYIHEAASLEASTAAYRALGLLQTPGEPMPDAVVAESKAVYAEYLLRCRLAYGEHLCTGQEECSICIVVGAVSEV